MAAALLDIVIARYAEDISWLQDVLAEDSPLWQQCSGVRVFIYNKGAPMPMVGLPPRVSVFCHQLPNVGRESHTYLHHIVEHYDSYASGGESTNSESTNSEISNSSQPRSVLFLQGNIRDHLATYRAPDERTCAAMLVRDAATHASGTSASFARPHDYGKHSARPEFRILHWRTDQLPAGMNLGEWFRAHVQAAVPPPDDWRWWAAALFCVTGRAIAAKPLGYYKQLLACVPDHHSPEVGHFFERSWLYIFTQ